MITETLDQLVSKSGQHAGKPTSALGDAFQRALRRNLKQGRMLMDRFGSHLAALSDCGDKPVFSASDFAWTRPLEAGFPAIRRELEGVLSRRDKVPNFDEVSPDQAHLTRGNDWKTYFLYAYGYKAERNCTACPETTRLVEDIPGMKTAFFSIMGPGTHVPAHRGPYKGLLRYHLGLVVPEPEQCSLRVAHQVLHWREGQSVMFDDTYEHEVWNDSQQDRVVLFVDVLRPMPAPWSLANRLLVQAVSMSPLVQDGLKRFQALEQQLA